MGIRYICDICGKEYDVKGSLGPTGYPVPTEPIPRYWAAITVMLPRCEHQVASPVGISAAYERMKGFSVCSHACAEKALDEAKELLRLAFEEATEKGG